MPTPAHNNIVEALRTVLQESDYEVPRRKRFPFPSLLERFDHRKLVPDLYANKKGKNQYDVFQVWDTEDYGAAAYEIMRVALTPNIASYSIILVENERLAKDSWTRSYAQSFVNGVLDVLDSARVSLSKNEVRYAEVDSETAKDVEETKRYLKKELGI